MQNTYTYSNIALCIASAFSTLDHNDYTITYTRNEAIYGITKGFELYSNPLILYFSQTTAGMLASFPLSTLIT